MPDRSRKPLSTDPQNARTQAQAEVLRLATRLDEVEAALRMTAKSSRKPGRFKGQLLVGDSFFQPLSEAELTEFSPE